MHRADQSGFDVAYHLLEHIHEICLTRSPRSDYKAAWLKVAADVASAMHHIPVEDDDE